MQSSYDYHFELSKETLFNWEKDNKILYHDAQNVFESRLIGNQFVYVSCFEDIGIHEVSEKVCFIRRINTIMNFMLELK